LTEVRLPVGKGRMTEGLTVDSSQQVIAGIRYIVIPNPQPDVTEKLVLLLELYQVNHQQISTLANYHVIMLFPFYTFAH